MTPTTDPKEEAKKMAEPENVQGPYSVPMSGKHFKALIDLMCAENNIAEENLVDFDLCFYDTTPGNLVGLHKEFISCPRQDNMIGSITAAYALQEFSATPPNDSTIDMFVAYDHEECGSISYQGAGGSFTMDAIERIYYQFPDEG